MKFFDYIKLALKNLWRRKVRTILTIIAVIIGTCAIVGLVSLAQGAQNVFIGQLEASGAMNRITVMGDKEFEGDFFGGEGPDIEDEDSVKLDDELMEKIKNLDYVTKVSPYFRIDPFQNAELEGRDKKTWADTYSISAEMANDINLQAGRSFTSDSEKNVIIVGEWFLNKSEYEDNPEGAIGKKVTFTTWEGYRNIDMELPPMDSEKEEWEKPATFEATIIGVGSQGPFERSMFIPLEWGKRLHMEKRYGETTEEEQKRAQQEFDEAQMKAGPGDHTFKSLGITEPQPSIEIYNRLAEKGYDSFWVSVKNAEYVESVANKIEEDFEVGAITSKEFLEQILRLFLIVQIVLGAIGGISLFVAAIGIINTMVMSIMERTKEIGVMRAVGATKKTIRKLFTIEASLIGFWGGVFGISIGIGLGYLVNYIGNKILTEEGMAVVNIVSYPWWLILGTIAFGTIIGWLAGVYPARKAAKLDPIEALHYE